jgi:hypothetical protein
VTHTAAEHDPRATALRGVPGWEFEQDDLPDLDLDGQIRAHAAIGYVTALPTDASARQQHT